MFHIMLTALCLWLEWFHHRKSEINISSGLNVTHTLHSTMNFAQRNKQNLPGALDLLGKPHSATQMHQLTYTYTDDNRKLIESQQFRMYTEGNDNINATIASTGTSHVQYVLLHG